MLQHGQYLLQPVAEEYVDIYWGLLTAPSSPSSIFSVYQLWKPWIQSLCPYTSPPDPPHVTLFYDSCHTEWYQDLFNETLEAKELGGVVKRSLAAGDWQDTSVTNLRHLCPDSETDAGNSSQSCFSKCDLRVTCMRLPQNNGYDWLNSPLRPPMIEEKKRRRSKVRLEEKAMKMSEQMEGGEGGGESGKVKKTAGQSQKNCRRRRRDMIDADWTAYEDQGDYGYTPLGFLLTLDVGVNSGKLPLGMLFFNLL
ncbi:hypothetical protein ILYODFUR_029642 [Ilyodon furcidens]|uniref:Uncharacterized protein n=1 Tax=Ilyodon furcidens TaxID=33524 RepID=A0ABV0T3Y9_9TELE